MYEGPIQDLIDELAKQPGLGPTGAQRIAFHLLAGEKSDIDRLVAAGQLTEDEARRDPRRRERRRAWAGRRRRVRR